MERPFNYHHLHYFKVIAELMSITEAASILNLAPSTLSDQLKTFEAELGVTLFERKPRLRLTREGRIVLEHARAIIAEGKRLRLRLDRPGQTEPLKLLIDHSVPKVFSTSVIALLRDLEVSGLDVKIFDVDPSFELRNQRFDIALVSNFSPDPAFEVNFIGEREFTVSVSPDVGDSYSEATVFLPPLITPEGRSAELWLKKRAISVAQSVITTCPLNFTTGKKEIVFCYEVPKGFIQIEALEGHGRRYQIVRPAGDGSGVIGEIFSLLKRRKLL